MHKYLLLLLLPFMFAGEAQAHQRHARGIHHGPGHVIYTPWVTFQSLPPRRIRISEHCVYKPWKDKTVCRF